VLKCPNAGFSLAKFPTPAKKHHLYTEDQEINGSCDLIVRRLSPKNLPFDLDLTVDIENVWYKARKIILFVHSLSFSLKIIILSHNILIN
jgi:hypothetical protein